MGRLSVNNIDMEFNRYLGSLLTGFIASTLFYLKISIINQIVNFAFT